MATSSSDRIGAARKLADHLEEKMKRAQWMPASEGIQAVHVIRALVEPDAVSETPEQVAGNILDKHRADYSVKGWRCACGHIYSSIGLEMGIKTHLMEESVKAGIQAAWESWEPETAPGAPSGEFDNTVAAALHGALTDRETEESALAAEWVAENENDLLWGLFVGPLMDNIERHAGEIGKGI